MTYNHVVSNIWRAFSDDDVYEELDDILAELDEDIYRIIGFISLSIFLFVFLNAT